MHGQQYMEFSYMFRRHVYHRQEELLCHLLQTRYCLKALQYGFYSSYVTNVSIS